MLCSWFKEKWIVCCSIIYFSFFQTINLFSQFDYDVLGTTDGLSQGFISDILQDREGFLWFSTKSGLNRYDGYSCKVFTHNPHDSFSLNADAVYDLFEDRKGRIWIATEGHGINLYNKKTGRFHSIQHELHNSKSLAGNRVFGDFIELDDGRIMIAVWKTSYEIIKIPEDYFENPKSKPEITHVDSPLPELENYCFKDKDNRIWILKKSVPYLLNQQTNDFQAQEYSKPFYFNIRNQNESYLVYHDSIYQSEDLSVYPNFHRDIAYGNEAVLLKDPLERMWIGIPNLRKLTIYDGHSWNREKLSKPEKHILFQDNAVAPNKFFIDQSAMLWLGTNGHGLRKYTFGTEKFNHIEKGFSVTKIAADLNNNLYIFGWGSIIKRTPSGRILPFDLNGAPGVIQDFMVSKDGKFWILHRVRKKENQFSIQTVQSFNPETKESVYYKTDLDVIYDTKEPILEDRHGNLWICGTNGEFIILNPETRKSRKYNINSDPSHPLLPDAIMTCLYEDIDGVYWMGTQLGFVKLVFDQYDESKLQVDWYRNIPYEVNSLNSNNVSCFCDDPFDSNILWISTKGGGLNRLNKKTNTWTHLTSKQGLCNDVVYGILTDAEGNLWGSTNNGIFCVVSNRKMGSEIPEIRHFTKKAGLQDAEFNTNAYAKLPNGMLAFGGINGLNVFEPGKILLDTFNPKVYITNLYLKNKLVKPDDATKILKYSIEFSKELTLQHDEDVITFEFASLDFRAPAQNKYRYQMEGLDPDWVEIGSRHNVTFSHLAPRKYRFKVQGSNSLGIWSQHIAEVEVTVLPPWWKTWWAYSLYFLTIAAAIRMFFLYKMKQTRIEEKLHYEQREAQRIKELDIVKTRLYTNITHEFRTPLTVIMGMAQHIKNSPSRYLENGIEMIIRNGRSLLNLVNELLDLSKIEAGKMELQLVEGDVIQFLRYIVESFHSMAESQGKQMHYLASLDNLNTKYDSVKLQQIISNLLSNALKFTPEKGNIYVTISVTDSVEHDHNQQLIVKIKDTGSGIPEDQIVHIFDRFYQVDSGDARKAEGTGIGLALTKELIQLMGGTISVKSPPIGAKKGTEFTVQLPMLRLDLMAIEEGNVIPVESAHGFRVKENSIEEPEVMRPDYQMGPIILLVEDNADVVAYIASCLPDYKLAVAKDGKEGFDLACEIIPDLIITDVMMPHMDGFEMSSLLRSDERTSHIPIIMLTAKADFESKLQGIKQGAEVYLEKPFHEKELVLRIQKLLEQRKVLQLWYSKHLGIPINPISPVKAFNQNDLLLEPIPAIESEFVNKVKEIIEQNIGDENFSVEQLSKHLFMSYSQLHRKLSAIIACSPNQYVRTLRMQKAIELLGSTNESIVSISEKCGFGDASYFGKVFRQEFGMTAQEYRNQKK